MLEDQILGDYKEAMKERDHLRSSVLSFLRAEMINLAIAKKKKRLEDIDTFLVIRKQIKARQDSIEQFTKGNRLDLAEKEKKELGILKAYLPQQLSEEEIKQIIAEVIVTVGAQGLPDMGKVIKDVNAKIAHQADGKLVSDLVRQRLANGERKDVA